MRMAIKQGGNWRSFRHHNYRMLFPANTVSNIGSWAQRVAQDWLVLELTNNNGTYLGLVTAVQFAPVLFLSLHGGVLADRLDKRKVLIATNCAGGATSIGLGLLVINDAVALWHVFALAGVLGIATAIDAPVRQAFSSELVGAEDLPNAVSLNSANFNAGRLVGPAISGFLIAAFGTGPSFLINGASYFFVIFALVKIDVTTLFHQNQEKSMGNIREAIAYVRARPDIYVVMIMVFALSTFGLNFQIFNALMATQEFGLGPASFGLMGTFVAIGSLSGAIGSARLERLRTTRFVIVGGVFFSISIMALSLLPNYTTYIFWLPICGLTALTTLVSANSIVQTSTDQAIRGRVMGLYLFIFMGGAPFGSPLIGLAADYIGIRYTIAVCGGLALAASLFVWIKYRDRVGVPEDVSIAAVLKTANSDHKN
ncbi:MAG: MFS transporter [Actinobacteria bacterium]|nr:MFS transporter [Candidatus Planktophila sp.]PHX66953.1 MAG: MFS transporter [Actinomycetota bacterium]